MLSVFLVQQRSQPDGNQQQYLEELEGGFSHVYGALRDIRHSWNEEEGPQTFLVIDAAGLTRAMCFRPFGDPELICTIDCISGRTEWHRCHYVTNERGYDHSVVTRVRFPRLADWLWRHSRRFRAAGQVQPA